MRVAMSKMEERLTQLVKEETGANNVTFKRVTATIFKLVIAGNHENYLDEVIMKFSRETDIYFDTFTVVHDGESRTVAILTYPNKEQYYLELLRKANNRLHNYNNMYGDIEGFNETNLINEIEEVL